MPDPAEVKQRAAQLESGLTQWINKNTSPDDEHALAVALLRMGVNGHIGIMGEAKAFLFLHDMFTADLALSVGYTKGSN